MTVLLQLLKIGKCLSFNKPQLPDVAGPVLFSAYSNRLYGAATITDQLDVIYGKAYSLCFAAHTQYRVHKQLQHMLDCEGEGIHNLLNNSMCTHLHSRNCSVCQTYQEEVEVLDARKLCCPNWTLCHHKASHSALSAFKLFFM